MRSKNLSSKKVSDVHIAVQDLAFSYNQNGNVLENINFNVKRNEIITIIGPNGGGKTTLLRLMLGLLEPSSGTIRISGESPKEHQGQIGYVPQHARFDRLFPVTVFDVVLSGLIQSFGFYSRSDKDRADKALEDVGLSSVKNRHIGELSGGQTQRMLIARALISEKDILLLDEPTSNVDPSVGKHLNSLVKDLSAKHTIILVTHDTGFVSSITDRVFCINKTIVEHPIDECFCEIVASSYGQGSSIVRHDKVIS